MSGDSTDVDVKKRKLDSEEGGDDGAVAEASNGAEAAKDLMDLPRKKFYRQRAHANPLSDRDMFHPATPETMNWNEFFGPKYQNDAAKVVNADIGCGYGGLLFKLSTIYPEECSVGFEIRSKVSRFVQDKIKALRHNEEGNWQNIACIRTNTMRFLCHFFGKSSLSRMFFLYPDPHFKKSKHKWRIISVPLIAEYAYLIKPGGVLYTVTDVLQYHEWVLECFAGSKLFEKIPDEELEKDPIFKFIFDSSEEGQKVTRNEGSKYYAIYRRTEVGPVFEPKLDGTSSRGHNAEDDASDHEESEKPKTEDAVPEDPQTS